MGKKFFRRTRQIFAGILGVFQGSLSKSSGKRPAETVFEGGEYRFSSYSPVKIRQVNGSRRASHVGASHPKSNAPTARQKVDFVYFLIDISIRTCIHHLRTPSRLVFSHCSSPNFLAIRQVFLRKFALTSGKIPRRSGIRRL